MHREAKNDNIHKNITRYSPEGYSPRMTVTAPGFISSFIL